MNDSASGDTPAPPFAGRAQRELGRVVVSEDELQGRVAALGKEITADYADRPPLLVGVLKGAFLFMSDLARCIDLPVELDFMAVSSYGSATKTSGVVRIIKDLDTGLVDFPHLRDGEVVNLCWKHGEDAVRFWHGFDEGYAHRKPLP